MKGIPLTRHILKPLIPPVIACIFAAVVIDGFHRQSDNSRQLVNRAADLQAAAFQVHLIEADALPSLNPVSEVRTSAEPALAAMRKRLTEATDHWLLPEDANALTAVTRDLERDMRKEMALISQNRIAEAMALDDALVDPNFDRLQDKIALAEAHASAAATKARSAAIFATYASMTLCILVGIVSTRRQQKRSLQEQEARLATLLEAEGANRAKSEFLSRMSHELRTPMNAILGFSQILQMDPLEPGPKEAVKQIMMAGKHLLVLINEVLDISRIDAGTMSLSTEPVIVRDVVDEAIALVSPLAQGQGIKIHLVYDHPEDVLVTADKQRLRQCLINILSNAVKYNREKGEVRVTCRCLDRTWRIEIADTGLGISDEKKKRLFTPFDRLGAETTQLEGTGLGLALSQRMAQQMGGAMDLLSSDESGSVFFITLPIAESSAKAEAITEGDFQPATVPCVLRILYIEDNRSNFLPTEKISATRPYVLQLTAKNGAEGGTEILRALRGNEKTSRIPVIVLSADASSGQIANLMTKGARALLTEPIDVPTLWATLDGPLNEEVRHAA